MDVMKYAVSPQTPVREAIQAIEVTGKKVVFVLEDDRTLRGLFTDGDMRRYILKNGDLGAPVEHAMNVSPTVFQDDSALKDGMEKAKRIVYPKVNSEGKLIDAVFLGDIVQKSISRTLEGIPLVIMAGGVGSRLKPYTNILPKALMPIGDMTITERIIEKFTDFEIKDIYLALNAKKNMVKAYFNELSTNYRVHYIEEDEPLGTGGGLSLLKDKISTSFFVSNCDILVDTDYGCIYDYHKKNGNLITVVCAMKNMVMPYGVVVLDEHENIKGIEEKPTQSFLTNTGVYLVEPAVLEFINDKERVDMTTVIMRVVENGKNAGVYPVSEKCWLDMGQIGELDNMLKELGES